MANLVKVKKVGIITSGLIISFLFAYHFITNEPSDSAEIKYWTPDSTLYLSDFMCTPHLFKKDETAARISSGIYWEHLGHGKFTAKTVINRHKSFFEEDNYSDYLLNHEKYHANISAVITQELNNVLKEKTFNNQSEFDNLLSKFNHKLKKLQAQYDLETDHSIIKTKQHYWEHKIDSMYYFVSKSNSTN